MSGLVNVTCPARPAGRRRIRWIPVAILSSLVLVIAGRPAFGGGLDLPDTPLTGRLLFEEKGCNQCHGIAGGGRGNAPDLGQGHFVGSFLDLGSALWNHVPGMSLEFELARAPWPEITEDEAVKLMAFLYFIEYLGRPGDPAAGQRLFSTRGCTRCHTIGEARRKTGPDLSELKRFASPLFIARSIWDHGAQMLDAMQRTGIAPPEFEEGDLADLSAFIRQASPSGPLERMLVSPGNPNRGSQVFRDKECLACHSVDGRGGQDGPDLSRSNLHRSAEGIAGAMWNHALQMKASMRERGLGWPNLTTTELADLVAYLYFLPFVDAPGSASRGRNIFVNRSCAGCHTADETSSHPGPDLTGRDVVNSPAALVAAMWNHAPVMKEAILAEGLPWPELTGNDLRDLLAYLSATGEQ